MSVDKIISSWKKKQYRPVYWLEGEESFYIDQVMDYAEHHLLDEAEKAFNLSIFYGKDAAWADVVNACMRYPMFAERQVVLLKEGQQMRDIDKLEPYINHPLSSTILVVSYKEKKVDGRSKLAKVLKEKGEMLSTRKLYDNQLPEWVTALAANKGYSLSQKALMLLVEHIGNDLSRINNELDKLALNLAKRTNITEDDIEKYIGVSKEYNVFELQEALARKNLARVIQIIGYFEHNPKAGPLQLILPTLYNHFSKVYTIFGMNDRTEAGVKGLFYNNPMAARLGIETAKNYGFEGVEKTILLLHEYNLKSIGINDAGNSGASLLKELAAKMVS